MNLSLSVQTLSCDWNGNGWNYWVSVAATTGSIRVPLTSAEYKTLSAQAEKGAPIMFTLGKS